MGKVRPRDGSRPEAGVKKPHPLSELDADILYYIERETQDNIECASY